MRHFGAIEADFQSHYGLDLSDALWGPRPIGLRRALALVKGLPQGGALHRTADPEGWNWTNEAELLATIAELLDRGNRILLAANSKQGTHIPEPLRINRPQQRQPKRGTTMADFREMALRDGAVHVS